ncbi:MAG: hypothetical protein U9R31_04235 [Candidatus Omnitrophota bacterium]|nr:hypothetical protein [Candidatus Omnitrophota bacterium]
MPKKLFVLLIILLFISSSAYAVDERFEDVIATVVVGSTFRLSIDEDSLDFGLIKPGKRIELYPERYYNRVTAISNNNTTWYLKMSLSEELRGEKGDIIPNDRLKWQVCSTDGDGIKVEGWQSFKDQPVLVYTSGLEDSRGKEVNIYLKYALKPPGGITAGHYHTAISYSMTESP